VADVLSPLPGAGDGTLDELDHPLTAGVARPPALPVVMLLLTTATALALVAAAVAGGAGQTSDIAVEAVLAWVIGSVTGVLVFAWFGLLDSVQRSTGAYVEPSWRPRTVAAVLAVAGWLAGSAGALLVAEAVARR
jgi:hypothetical protein